MGTLRGAQHARRPCPGATTAQQHVVNAGGGGRAQQGADVAGILHGIEQQAITAGNPSGAAGMAMRPRMPTGVASSLISRNSASRRQSVGTAGHAIQQCGDFRQGDSAFADRKKIGESAHGRDRP